MISLVHVAFDNVKSFEITLLVLSKAFDSISHQLQINKLEYYGVKVNLTSKVNAIILHTSIANNRMAV